MKTEAFMELVSGISYSIASVKGCPVAEVGPELARLQQSITAVREARWPQRLSDANRAKALRLMNLGNQLLAERAEQHQLCAPFIQDYDRGDGIFVG